MTASNQNLCVRHRILAVMPIPYGDNWGFWYRDLGLVVRALRSMGHDAWLVALKDPTQVPGADKPVIVATKEELEDPAWWENQTPYGVIMNFWGATRWEGIREAARQATPRLVEKLDTAGNFSPRMNFWRYVYENHSYGLTQSLVSFVTAPAVAFARACVLWILPNLLDEKRAGCLSRMPVVAAESPIAVERTKRYIRSFGFPVPRVCCIPHPVDETDLDSAASVERENKIISVGRWDSHQKNFPLLISVLGEFLLLYPGWRVEIAGAVSPSRLERYAQKLPDSIRRRIRMIGNAPHTELASAYRSSKIYFMPSRHEAFSVAASEALYSGCSVVTSIDVGGAQSVTGRNCGTAACRMTKYHLLEALCAEAEMWLGHERDPAGISSNWRGIVGSKAVAAKLMNELEKINQKRSGA